MNWARWRKRSTSALETRPVYRAARGFLTKGFGDSGCYQGHSATPRLLRLRSSEPEIPCMGMNILEIRGYRYIGEMIEVRAPSRTTARIPERDIKEIEGHNCKRTISLDRVVAHLLLPQSRVPL